MATDSRGPNIDARKLEFLEELFGEEWFQQNGTNPNPFSQSAEELETSWDTVFNSFKAHLIFQSGGYSLFDSSTVYNPVSGEIEGEKDLVQAAIDDLETAASQPGVDEEAFWIEVGRFLEATKGLVNLTTQEEAWLDDAVTASGPSLDWEGIETAISDDPGSPDDDILDGDGTNNTLSGGAGNDTLNGFGGNDNLSGGTGNDTLNGGAGNDTLDSGAGGDFVYGADGDDTYIYTAGDDFYSEYLTGDDFETIKLPQGISLNDLTMFAVDTDDPRVSLFIQVGDLGTIAAYAHFYGSDNLYGIDQIEFYDTTTFDLTTMTAIDSYGTNGNDDIRALESSGSDMEMTLYGLEGNDELWGATGDDTLIGGVGNDILRGSTGNDTYVMGEGFDEIHENGGTDTLVIPEGYTEDDVAFLWLGTDHMTIMVAGLGQVLVNSQFHSTGFQIENIEFAETSTVMSMSTISIEQRGGDGNDTINPITTGASANNILNGMAGNDNLVGDSGNDTYIASAGLDTVDEASGTDTIQYGTRVDLENLFFTNTGADDVTIVLNSGTDEIKVLDQRGGNSAPYAEKILFDSGFSVNFANYANWITAANGDANANTILGNASANTLSGNGGNDELHGMAGNDTLHGNDGNDLIHCGSGNDTLSGEAGNDMLWGGDGTDTADYTSSTAGVTIDLQNTTASGGDAAGDTLTSIENVTGSNTAADVIYGDANANSISGLGGNDFLEGGAGADTIDGGAGWDNVRYTRATSGVTVNLATNVNTGSHAEGDLLSNIEAVVGSNYDDSLTGNSSLNTLTGGSGNDTLDGGAGNDTLAGGTGTDTAAYASATSAVTVSLAAGTATGGAGSDTLTDIENITGSAYADTLTGNGNANTLTGGAGGDAIDGGSGTDTADYTGSTAAVSIDLQNGTASGGDAENMRRTFWKQLLGYTLCALTAMLAIELFREPLVRLVYGEAYVSFSDLLTGWGMILCCFAMSGPLETVIVKQGRLHLYNLCRLPAGLTGILLSFLFCEQLGAWGALSACIGGWLVSVGSALWLVRDVMFPQGRPSAIQK